jgi:hypothetical protein
MAKARIPARCADRVSHRAEQLTTSRLGGKSAVARRNLPGSDKIHADVGTPFSGCGNQELQAAVSRKGLLGL